MAKRMYPAATPEIAARRGSRLRDAGRERVRPFHVGAARHGRSST